MNPTTCPACHAPIVESYFFCPNCGRALKEKAPIITIPKQVLIYAVSFFLAPLGLGWGLKYIFSKDMKVRIVGIVSILLTVASIIIMLVAAKSFLDQYLKILNGINPTS